MKQTLDLSILRWEEKNLKKEANLNELLDDVLDLVDQSENVLLAKATSAIATKFYLKITIHSSTFFNLGTSLNFEYSSIGIGIGPTSSQIVAKTL